MPRYEDRSGRSGVKAYIVGPDFIEVLFKTGKVYRYSYQTAGEAAVEKMKKLAATGRGLSTYISRDVRSGYEGAE